MSLQTIGLLAVAYLAASGLWTANDPFVGKWKLDVSRSVIIDQMVVEAAGPNTYRFRLEGSPPETIVADGTDQPGLPGTTLSVKAEDTRTLRVIRKQAGRIIVDATWKLSDEGKVLRDAFKGIQPNGSTLAVDYVYRRRTGSSGFVGTWESTTQPSGLEVELEIQPYGGAGLSFTSQGAVTSVTFDGREHAVPGATDGVEASGRRPSERTMEYTKTDKGQVLATRSLKLSGDGKTLTMNVHRTGQATPDMLVFARE